jgi:glutamate/tyrosine decarboxylase-like PLP-dependent enzyme
VHGTDAFTEAVERTLALTRAAADEIRSRPELELLCEPELTVLVFRRHGWQAADYDRWAADLRRSGTAFVLPTVVDGEPVARIAIVNPTTTLEDVQVILDGASNRKSTDYGG